MSRFSVLSVLAVLAFPVLTVAGFGQGAPSAQVKPQYPDYPSETPTTLVAPTPNFDFERREAMIQMRDGVALHTVILVPKGAQHAPILLTRTPYSANALTRNAASAHLGRTLYGYDNATDVIVEG